MMRLRAAITPNGDAMTASKLSAPLRAALHSIGSRRQPGALAALIIAAAGAPSAHGAETAPSADIEEITVTATRRAQTLDTVPISVSAFSHATMDEQGLKNIDDVSRFTPGLTFAPSKAGYINDIAIRGVLSEVGASTTGVYID